METDLNIIILHGSAFIYAIIQFILLFVRKLYSAVLCITHTCDIRFAPGTVRRNTRRAVRLFRK